MAKIDRLIIKISLGMWVVANLVVCIVTTDLRVLVPVNILVALLCFGLFLFMQAKCSGLAADLGISKQDARKLIADYFDYYKNVERISIYEYVDRLPARPADDHR